MTSMVTRRQTQAMSPESQFKKDCTLFYTAAEEKIESSFRGRKVDVDAIFTGFKSDNSQIFLCYLRYPPVLNLGNASFEGTSTLQQKVTQLQVPFNSIQPLPQTPFFHEIDEEGNVKQQNCYQFSIGEKGDFRYKVLEPQVAPNGKISYHIPGTVYMYHPEDLAHSAMVCGLNDPVRFLNYNTLLIEKSGIELSIEQLWLSALGDNSENNKNQITALSNRKRFLEKMIAQIAQEGKEEYCRE